MNEQMAALTFGVEIETSGLSQASAASAIAAALPGASLRTVGGYYGKIEAVMADGRAWTCMSDASILSSGSGAAEVVSPILKGAADVELLQTVVRALRAAGAKSSAEYGCGIHVHVGVGHLPIAALGRIAKLTTRVDAMIRTAVGVSALRARWCAPLTTPTFASGHSVDVERLGRARSRDEFARTWYGSARDALSATHDHYNGSRYHAANFHSYFYSNRGTVEFRYFDGTLHAGEIRSYVMLCLGLVARASQAAAASAKPMAIHKQGAVVNWRVWLIRDLGFAGPEYAAVRKHLCKRFPKETRAAADRRAA